MLSRRSLLALAMGAASSAALSARSADRPSTATSMPEAPSVPFAQWTNEEPLYLFYPGDKIEIEVPGAPELSRTTQVGPDGRITLGLIGQVMAAYKSVPELQLEIQSAYASTLRDPNVTVYPGETAPIRILVGGEVKTPGWVDMVGDMDALQAVIAAGGFLHSAKTHQVAIIRRGRQGEAMRQIVDLQDPLSGRASQLVALRRYDIVFVPRTSIAEAGVYMEQWVNNLIPGGILNYFAYRTFQ